MFRHQGKRRTFKTNLRIAIVLSFVAGTVNLAGFFAIYQLTTNVTGHFALFINGILQFELWKGLAYFLYIKIQLNVLIIVALILLTKLIYNDMVLRFLLVKRKYRHKKMA